MDAFNGNSLRRRKLDNPYDNIGRQHHPRTSAGEVWQRVKYLREGGFGEVWQEHCVSGPSQKTTRAIKCLSKQRTKEMSARELNALVTFSNPDTPEYKQYFVQFLGWFEDDRNLYIAMEYLALGDLRHHITKPFPEPEAACVVAQVARALQYMHRKNFVHRDIKPENILVSRRGPNWDVKVADFGISKNIESTTLATKIGTPGYMAPEQALRLGAYTTAVDVWALGAVTFCLRTTKPPFLAEFELRDYYQDPKLFPYQRLGNSSDSCKDFVLRTMANLPQRRPTIEGVLAHAWLVGLGAPRR